MICDFLLQERKKHRRIQMEMGHFTLLCTESSIDCWSPLDQSEAKRSSWASLLSIASSITVPYSRSWSSHPVVTTFLSFITGCDVNSVNCYGYTPLHWAAAKGELWLVDHLLKRGANPCCRTTLSGALPSTCASEFSQSTASSSPTQRL